MERSRDTRSSSPDLDLELGRLVEPADVLVDDVEPQEVAAPFRRSLEASHDARRRAGFDRLREERAAVRDLVAVGRAPAVPEPEERRVFTPRPGLVAEIRDVDLELVVDPGGVPFRGRTTSTRELYAPGETSREALNISASAAKESDIMGVIEGTPTSKRKAA